MKQTLFQNSALGSLTLSGYSSFLTNLLRQIKEEKRQTYVINKSNQNLPYDNNDTLTKENMSHLAINWAYIYISSANAG